MKYPQYKVTLMYLTLLSPRLTGIVSTSGFKTLPATNVYQIFECTAIIHLYSQICFLSPRMADPSSRGDLPNFCTSLSVTRCYNYLYTYSE